MAYIPSPQNLVSTSNSTASVLAGGAVFTGTSEDISQYGMATVSVAASHASATNGLSIQQSSDGTNWDVVDTYTVAAAVAATFSLPRQEKFFRVVYTNGATLQTSFRLQTIFTVNAGKSSSQRPGDAYTNEVDLEQMAAFNMLYNGTTWDRVRGDTANGLDVDVTRMSALVAGAATIGSIASITTSVVPGTAAASLGKAEDAVHSSGDVGVMMLGVRNDGAASTFTSTSIDYSPLATDAQGRLYVVQKAPTATLSNVSTSTASATLIAANTARVAAQIYNDAAAVLYVKFGATASATSFTVPLAANSYYEVPGGYTGIIDGILASGTGTSRATELT